MLRDRLVCGINDAAIQRRLLAEKDLDFKKAFEMAQAMEVATENARTLQQTTTTTPTGAGATTPGGTDESVLRFDQSKNRMPPRKDSAKCSRCGSQGHIPYQCKFRTAKCFNCSKIGHIAAVCRSRTEERHVSEVKLLEGAAIIESMDDPYTLFSLPSADKDNRQPLTVEVCLNGIPHRMELDTGASVSLMAKSTLDALWPW